MRFPRPAPRGEARARPRHRQRMVLLPRELRRSRPRRNRALVAPRAMRVRPSRRLTAWSRSGAWVVMAMVPHRRTHPRPGRATGPSVCPLCPLVRHCPPRPHRRPAVLRPWLRSRSQSRLSSQSRRIPARSVPPAVAPRRGRKPLRVLQISSPSRFPWPSASPSRSPRRRRLRRHPCGARASSQCRPVAHQGGVWRPARASPRQAMPRRRPRSRARRRC